ncbi:major facilitator superfamily transporter [Rhexocercosporidium sp. MPI-PUGE-AT-0058]|nr:major facilitator superfamily transporter [Rhexocercosporidium sp. MPI-PUGE-AT-0058]
MSQPAMSDNAASNKVPSVPESGSADEVFDKEGANAVTEKANSGLEKETAAAEDVVYPTGFRIVAIMIGLGLAVFCVSIDNTIITTAIPTITNDFEALSDVGWYGSAYLLTFCAFNLFFGRLYQRFSVKWTFLTCLALFEIGSLICGVAPNSTTLIVGRAFAGVGSSGLFSGALIILAHATPLEKRPVYTGLIAGIYGIASVVGPLLGGAFTDHATWRWSFYINLPIGAITAFTIIFFFASPPSQMTPDPNATWGQKIMQFDPIGTLLFLPSVVCVLLALQWGGTKYPWSDGRIIALFVLFAVLLIAFIGVQYWAGENATVPLRIIKQRSIASAAYFSLCVGAAFFITVFYLPIWFQAVRDDNATESGINTLPMMISFTLGAIVGGGVVTTYGYYTPFLYALVVIASIGAGLLTTFTVGISIGKWIGYQIILGWGIGIGMQQTLVAAQAVLPLVDVPVGTAVVIFSQMFGGSLFVSVAQNVFTNKLVEGLETVENLGIDPRSVISTGATEIAKLITDSAVLDQVKVVYNDAIVWTFRVALIMICLSLFGAVFMEWKSVKKASQDNKTEAATSEA